MKSVATTSISRSSSHRHQVQPITSLSEYLVSRYQWNEEQEGDQFRTRETSTTPQSLETFSESSSTNDQQQVDDIQFQVVVATIHDIERRQLKENQLAQHLINKYHWDEEAGSSSSSSSFITNQVNNIDGVTTEFQTVMTSFGSIDRAHVRGHKRNTSTLAESLISRYQWNEDEPAISHQTASEAGKTTGRSSPRSDEGCEDGTKMSFWRLMRAMRGVNQRRSSCSSRQEEEDEDGTTAGRLIKRYQWE